MSTVEIVFERADGTRSALCVPVGSTAMQAAVGNGIEGIVGECGGSAMCATCHVYAVGGPVESLAPVSAVEDAMLDSTVCERRPQSRLGCQIVLAAAHAGLVLRLPERQT
jgi:ferredoxin, 2Fe-2S